MLELLLLALEKMGRKKVLVSFDGQVLAHRWYLLYKEDDEDGRLIARLPNIYFHRSFQLESPDGPHMHRHAWNTWSRILAGGYLEEVNGLKVRKHGPGDWACLKHTDFHRILRFDPGTLTMFCHGFRRSTWGFKAMPCKVVCGRCQERYGECVNRRTETPHSAHFSSDHSWRTTAWIDANRPGLEDQLRRRREAVKRVQVLTPGQVREKLQAQHFGEG